MPEPWIVGEYARLTLTVANASGAAADPGALRLKVRNPAGTVTEYIYGVAAEIVRTGLGKYRADVVVDAPGRWAWRWETTAPNAGAAEGELVVTKSKVL
jgi:hypothetical protein